MPRRTLNAHWGYYQVKTAAKSHLCITEHLTASEHNARMLAKYEVEEKYGRGSILNQEVTSFVPACVRDASAPRPWYLLKKWQGSSIYCGYALVSDGKGNHVGVKRDNNGQGQIINVIQTASFEELIATIAALYR